MDITVTDKAFRQLIMSGLGGTSVLRLGVKQGGCAGLSYSAYIDNTVTETDDILYDKDDLRVIVDQEYSSLVDGLNIDFSDDLIQPGYILKNPNSSKSCGCGASFKAKEGDTITPCGGNC